MVLTDYPISDISVPIPIRYFSTLAHSEVRNLRFFEEGWRRGAVISVEAAVFYASTFRSNVVRT